MIEFDNVRRISLKDITKGKGTIVINGVEVKEAICDEMPTHITRKEKKTFAKRYRKPKPLTMSITAEAEGGGRKLLEYLTDEEICTRERKLSMKSNLSTKR